MRIILLACLVLFFVGCSQNTVPQDNSLASEACVDKKGVFQRTVDNKGCAIVSESGFKWDCGPAPKAGEVKWGISAGSFWELSCTGVGQPTFLCPVPYFWKKIGDNDWGCVAS